MSTYRFGFASRSRPTRPRSSAAQPTCAPTNVVAGWRATRRPKAASSSSNGGKPGASGSSAGRVGQKCQSGCSRSSSQRSFVASSGSKNATGSAMWMTTGRPSSAAVAHSGSSRGSSTGTSRPPGRSPAGRAASRPSGRGRPARRRRAAVETRSHRTPDRRPTSRSRGRRTRRRAPARASASGRSRARGRRPGRRRGPRSPRSPASSRTASSSAGDRSGQSPANGEPRWLWASMTGNRGRPTGCAGTRSIDRGRKSASRRSGSLAASLMAGR